MEFVFSAPLDFPRTLKYIGRYETAQRHAVADGKYYQVLSDGRGYFLVEVSQSAPRTLSARMVRGRNSQHREQLIARFMQRTFGPDDELKRFYRFAKADPVLAKIVKKYRGLRLVGVVNLWECLAWSIIGQQVSVQSAFATRSRLVREAGALMTYQGIEFEGFPPPSVLLQFSEQRLRACGCSRQKADYLLALAHTIHSGELIEDQVLSLPVAEARQRLLSLRGIGPWSVEYCMMRVHGDADACPLEDIGLRNALTNVYGLERQATIRETETITNAWKPFRSYGTFYLWQTLLENRK
jgi:DNA-3-methyladenine glycosylase II